MGVQAKDKTTESINWKFFFRPVEGKIYKTNIYVLCCLFFVTTSFQRTDICSFNLKEVQPNMPKISQISFIPKEKKSERELTCC